MRLCLEPIPDWLLALMDNHCCSSRWIKGVAISCSLRIFTRAHKVLSISKQLTKTILIETSRGYEHTILFPYQEKVVTSHIRTGSGSDRVLAEIAVPCRVSPVATAPGSDVSFDCIQ